MNFNKHSAIEGQHAFLGASTYHWINYDNAKLIDRYNNFLAVQRGTQLHAFAAQCIKLGQRLPKSRQTLNQYVNDAIGFKMTPEQILYYSPNCLKTGVTPVHMEQLEIYAALFCLEYHKKPGDMEIELRLYWNNEIMVHCPTVEDILPIMDKIVAFDKIISDIKEQEE